MKEPNQFLIFLLLSVSLILAVFIVIFIKKPPAKPVNIPNPNQFCGGIAGLPCPSGFTCQLDGVYPDAGGTCVKINPPSKYTCPKNGWVDCMPGIGKTKSECNPQAIQWIKQNCPNFQGVAY